MKPDREPKMRSTNAMRRRKVRVVKQLRSWWLRRLTRIAQQPMEPRSVRLPRPMEKMNSKFNSPRMKPSWKLKRKPKT